MRGFIKRKKLITKLLALSMLLTMLPSPVYAAPDEETTGTSETVQTQDAAAGQTTGTKAKNAASASGKTEYSVTPETKAPVYTAFKGMVDWTGRKAIEAPENTYVLTAATGARAGDGVLYFALRYKDTAGGSRNAYIFPGIDAASRSAALLKHFAKDVDISATYGKTALQEIRYAETEVVEKQLGAWTVQDFAFQTEAEVASVESIDVYMNKGQWTVQGLSLYRMTRYKGYEEFGLVSGRKFLDFEGYLIADLVKKTPGSSLPLTAGTQDTVIRLGGSDSLFFDVKVYEDQSSTRSFASAGSLYSFRMDFADQMGAGLETFLNYSGRTLDSDNGIVEDITMEIQYRDTHGWTRKATLPMMLSTYIQARKAEPDSTILGLAQRGDTIAFQGYLPEFAGLLGQVVISTGNLARESLAAGGISVSNATSKMNESQRGLAKDDLRIAGVSIYRGGCMPYTMSGTDSDGATLKGATLEYLFEGNDPIYYYTTTAVGGQLVSANGVARLGLKTYAAGAPLIAGSQLKDKFLVTLSTSSVARAGTRGDVSLQLFYTTQDGDSGRTQVYQVRESAEEFMGKWPATDGTSFIAKSGLGDGESISFVVEAQDVKEFTGAEIGHSGNDEWEMENLSIDYLESYSHRRAFLVNGNSRGTHFWMMRNMMKARVYDLRASTSTFRDEKGNQVDSNGSKKGDKVQLRDEKGNPIYDSSGHPVYVDQNETRAGDYQTSGRQLFDGDKTYRITFGDGIVSDVREMDYSEVRYSMSWEQTGMNWGFFKSRKTYEIAVSVATDDDHDLGNGDAGSVNHFYFQLIFKTGKSGFVLANQQLAGDGFRSGRTEYFNISVNRNYGDVKAIRIIPEDMSNDSTPFDKLNIAKITVSEQTNGGSYLSYTFDNVGWIDIAYREEGEQGSSRGQRARTVKELAREFRTPVKSRAVKLLCEVNTLSWEGKYNQFVGSVWATLDYIDTKNVPKTVVFDVVSQMASYMNSKAKAMEVATNPNQQVVKAAGQGSISDPEWMFRAGKTDRFFIPAISDLKSVKQITFAAQTKNNESAYLNFGKVSMSQVLADGPMQLTANEEKIRNIKSKRLCVSVEPESITHFCKMGILEDMQTIQFSENEVVWTSEEWATPVARIPETQDDTVNIYVYPTSANGGNYYYRTLPETPYRVDDSVSVSANLKYNIPYSQMMATSAKLQAGADGSGATMYYALGVSAPNMVSASNLTLKCLSTSLMINHAIVQHVRSGVVVATYTYSFFDATAVLGLNAPPASGNGFTDLTEEKLSISFGNGTTEQNLQPMSHDVAVAFTYHQSLDTSDTEYISPFVYLTDQQYKKLAEGDFVELNFNIPFVREITGYDLAAYGNLTGSVNAASAVVYHVDEQEQDATTGEMHTKTRSAVGYVSFDASYELSERMRRHPVTSKQMFGEGAVTPIQITFNTVEMQNALEGQKDAAVRAVFTYRDFMGLSRTVQIPDLTKYIQEPTKAFRTGEQTVSFFLSEMSSDMTISSVTLMPYNSEIRIDDPILALGSGQSLSPAAATVDTLVDQMKGSTGIFADNGAAGLSAQILSARNASWTIQGVKYVAGMELADGTKPREILRAVNQTFAGMNNGDLLRLNTISLATYVSQNGITQGQIQGGNMQLVANGGDVISGTVTVMQSTAGFTAKAYRMMGDAGEEVTADTITIDNSGDRMFTFTAPRNVSGELMIYKIEISPVDAPDLVDRIFVSVKSDEISMTTQLTQGDKVTEVQNHSAMILAHSNDKITVGVQLFNTTEGFTASATRVIDSGGEAVTDTTISGLKKSGFTFIVPENKTGSTIIYKLEIAPQEAADKIDTIMITVESDPVPEEDTASTEEKTEKTEEKDKTEADTAGGSTEQTSTP